MRRLVGTEIIIRRGALVEAASQPGKTVGRIAAVALVVLGFGDGCGGGGKGTFGASASGSTSSSSSTVSGTTTGTTASVTDSTGGVESATPGTSTSTASDTEAALTTSTTSTSDTTGDATGEETTSDTTSDTGVCGGPPVGGGGDEEAPEGGVVPIGCDDPGGFGTPAEFAQTPREDPRLEGLAVELDGDFFADQETYDRLVDDVYAIRCDYPEVKNIDYFEWSIPNFAIVFDEPTSQMVKDGTYHGWDCLNAWYGFHTVLISNDGTVAVLRTANNFNMWKIAPSYEDLPGVMNAHPLGVAGDGPSICVTVEGDVWHYVFEDRFGDCAEGCTEEHDYYFSTSIPGQATLHAEWASNSNAPAPPWVALYGC